MSNTFGTLFGFFLNIFRRGSHILLLLLHNLIFVAIAAAILWVIFKYARAGVRKLRGRGIASEQSKSPPGTGPENGVE
jgi:hypothetical protein